MSLLLRGLCALACFSQSPRPTVQQQLPARAVNPRQTTAFVPRSPCPEYFQYQTNTWNGELRGVLTIPPPQDSTTISITLGLRINARMEQGSFTGKIELAEGNDKVIQRLRQGNRTPIPYNVVFPVQHVIPILTSIVVNQQTICQSHPGTANGYYTDVTLTHKLISPFPIIFASNYGPADNNAGTVVSSGSVPQAPQQQQFIPTTARTTSTTWTTPSPPPPTQAQTTTTSAPSETAKFSTCGVSPRVANLVVNGDTVTRGEWPWLSALYDVTKTGISFICGGSLITNRHVITAAHCVVKSQGSAILKNAEDILVYLGKYNIVSFTEKDTVLSEILHVIAHPEYTGQLEYAGIDLAILTFKTPTTFGPYIRPVCLWDPSRQYPQTGKVVGWGLDEYGNAISKTPKQVDMPIVSNEQCLRANPDYAKITSETTFCAGNRTGSGPCKGDSGGGLYVWDENARKWSIRGVVSQSLWDHEKRSCDLKNYVTFTDVSKLLNWIKQMI